MKKIIFSIIAIICFAITSLAQVVEIVANGPVTFCTGGTVQLTGTVTPSGIYQYQWMKDNVNISGQNTLTYVANSSGVYSLKATALNNTVYNSNAITVTVNTMPAAPIVTFPSPAVICGGSSIILSDNSSTNVSYQWFFNNNPINNATNSSYAANQPGTYKLVVSHLTTGCSSTSQNVIVGEMPKIISETIVTCGNGATISLTNPNFSYSTATVSCNVDMSTASIVTNNQTECQYGQKKIICYGGNYTYSCGGATYVVEYGGTLNNNNNNSGTTIYVKAGGILNYISGPASSTIVYYEPGAIINAGTTQTIQCNNIGVIYPSNTTELCNNLTYLWSNGATTPTITVNPSVQTTYSVTVSNGSISCTDQVVVIPGEINSPPTITTSGPTTINQGGSIELTSSYPTGNLWCNGATTQSITVSQIGSYSVSVSNGNCTSTSQPVVVTFNNIQTLPLLQNFEDQATYTSVAGFGGAGAAIVLGASSCSATGNVLQGIQNSGGEVWQGIYFKLTTKKVKLTSNKTMQVDVFANQAFNILGKVEMGGPTSANGQAYTTPGQWQTLTFDFSIPMDQTSVANGEYEQIVFFGNWNSTNTGFNSPPVALTFKVDNIRAEQVCLVAPAAPIVSYTSPAVICDGGSLTLTVNSSTNVSYQWYLNDSPISNATNNSYTATVAGTYKLVNTNLSSSCSSTSQNIIVGEMPKIVANTIVTCGNNTTISLTNSNFNFSTLPATCNVDMSSASILTTNQSGSESGHRKIICNGGIYTNNGNNNKYVVENGGTLNFNGGSGACVAYIKSGGTFNFISGDFPTITIYYEPGAIINAGTTQTIQCNNIGVIYPSNTTALCNNLTYLWSNGATTPSITVNPSVETTYTVTVSKGSVSCTDQVIVTPGEINPLPPIITASGPTALCQGESVVLTSSYPTGNVWSNGATTPSITVTQSGSYTVSYGSCSVSSLPKVVTVTTPPNSLTILPSGPTTICEGGSVTLSFNSLSSVRYLKFESYYSSDDGQVNVYEIQAFSNGVNVALNKPGFANSYGGGGGSDWASNGSKAVDGNSGSRWSSNRNDPGPDLNDPHYIVIDLQNQFNLESILLNISNFQQTFSFKVSQDNVNWIEVGNGNSASGSFTFTPPLTNFSSYLWSNGATTPSITVSESGAYSVTAFIGTTCSVVSNTIAVTVNAVPTAPTISTSGSTSLCQGETVVLTSSYPTGNTWSNGATTQSITVSQSGSYSVSVSNSNCNSVSQPVAVTVTQVPSSINIVLSGPTTICQGSTVSLSLNSLSAVRYLKYECSFNPSGQARVAEIQAFSNGVNVALNKSGYASSYSGTGTWQTNGKNAVDGLSSTIWTSNSNSAPSITNPQFIVIDLETPQENIESIILNIGVYTQTFSFKVSQDGINWTQIGTGQSITGTSTFTIPQNTINYSSYLWSNGVTTPSITVTESGTYSVTAYIGSTCSVTSNSVNVVVNPIPVTPTISASGSLSICQGESVVLTSSYATGNLWSNGATSQSITVTQSGSYTVINGGCSAPSLPIIVTVASQPSTLLSPNNIVITTSQNQCVANNVNLGSPTGQSCTNFTITNNAPAEFPIGLTVVAWTLVNENGTTITANQNVTVNFNFDSTNICYVTSDETLPNRNRIYINNANSNNVLEYQILREVSTNVYNVIGNIPTNQNSFLDITSDNLSLSYKYKLKTVSICNLENTNSTIHKTILLQSNVAINNTVNLSWSPYEGLIYGTYKVYRKTGNGPFEEIASFPTSNVSYNDVTANILTNTYEYYIGVEVPACSFSPQGRSTNTFSINQIRSNILNTSSTLELSNHILDLGVMIYPNPTSDILNIKIDNTLTYLKTEIYNIIGQKLSETDKIIINVSDLPNASYFVKIITEEGTAPKTFIKK